MRRIKRANNCRMFNTLLIIYALTFTFVIPMQILGETFPANSIFNQKASGQIEETNTDESFGNIPVYFEENQGQFNSKVKYFARGTSGYSLFLTGTEAVYVLRDSSKFKVQNSKLDNRDLPLNFEPDTLNSKATAVFMKLAGANENSTSSGLEEMSHKTNYFKGEESNWRTEIPNFKQIQINNIYGGIDAVWKGKENGGVQYDFVVQPNANPNQIKWEIEGAESVEIDEKGDLLIKTEFGEIRQQKPFTYQKNSNGLRQEIESGFIIENELRTKNSKFKISFELGNYDRTKTLTIDPSVNLSNLAYSTFLGGSGSDFSNSIAVDKAGNVFVTGRTTSISFPTTAGTIDTTHNGSEDVFVTKLNANGTNLIYSTFLGGDADDEARKIVIDTSGNAFITGFTANGTIAYPTTAGAFDTTYNGGNYDVFVTKLNAAGSTLVYSTFVGGGAADFGLGIGIDISGNAFITGGTADSTTDYPTTAGAFDETHNGGDFDLFVTKLNAAGSALVYSTFIGGNLADIGSKIVIDSSGNALVSGTAENGITAYPTTAGAFDTTHNGEFDAVVTKLNAAGSALVYSTFIGGDSTDDAYDIAPDAAGNAYIIGVTKGGTISYPTTAGAFDTTHNGNLDVFVTKLNAAGSALVYSTFIGGSADDFADGIIVDAFGNAFISGQTDDGAIDYPTTAGAFENNHNGGGSDVFVTKLNAAGSALDYSTFIGGNSSDSGYGIAIDTSGNVFVQGNTFGGSTAYPTTAEAFDTTHDGDRDVFISKLGDFSISGRTLDTSGNPLSNTAVAMSGDTDGFMLSDSDGNFYFGDTFGGGTNLVSATQILYNFNPANYQVNVNRNKKITFVGRPTSSGPTAALEPLGGQVQSTVGNVGLPNTRLTLIDTVNGDVSEVTTDANGNYEFESVTTGMFYLVVAEREGYNFAPQIFEVNHFDQNLNLDFLASPNSPRPIDDFDGDGKTDLAVFRPESGIWYILNSQDNSVKTVQFGLNGDIPVASDYDGDERADIAVYRPSEGNWYVLDSADGEFHSVHFGQIGDLPVQADFDGDNKTDPAVYRPESGTWHRFLSESGSYQATQFGIETDQPIAADYDSDGKADLTVYRDGIWYRLRSSDAQVEAFQFGVAEDKPVTGDFDGDSRLDTAVYRPSNGAWYWLDSTGGKFHSKQFGNETDTPTPADYNGDGRFEQSVFRNGTWYVLRNDNSFYASQFGQTDDLPIPGN